MSTDPKLDFEYVECDLEVQTDISQGFIAHFCPFVRSAIQAIVRLPLHAPLKNQTQPLRIWVLRDAATFASFALENGFDPKGSFVGARGRAYIRGEASSVYETRRRTLHEIGHILHRRCEMDVMPAHLKEGFVNFISLHDWDGRAVELGRMRGINEPHSAGILSHLVNNRGHLLLRQSLVDPKAAISLGSAVAGFILRDATFRMAFSDYLSWLRRSSKPYDYAGAYSRFIFPNEALHQTAFAAHVDNLIQECHAASTPHDVGRSVDSLLVQT